MSSKFADFGRDSARTADEAVTVNMKYTRLGKSGLKISKVILGTMGYGDPRMGDWVLDEEGALPLLEHAYKRGINTWDTADFYSQGKSEEVVGKAIKKLNIPRQNLVILTKCFFGVDEEVLSSGTPNLRLSMVNDGYMVNRVGLSRKHILDAVDASVARLGTYIDVLQIHRLDRDVTPEEIMKALNDVVESGKVRYLGASSMAAWEFQMLNNTAERNGWHKFISMQNYHNLLYREEEREMHPYCNYAGIGLIPWSPLAQGTLARPWKDDASSVRAQNNAIIAMLTNDGDKDVVDRLEEVSKRLGVSMATVATAWSLKKGVNPILGLQSIGRIDEAVETVNFELSDADVEALEEPYRAKAAAPVF
ncbi:NADP-dependent oxidoreductase domain-containing protein [Dendryphion nanum]|uniref:NADP-dependent oxidoreductase domain-containing protein n=1 Tax=Dendryphion nanum TaxID=256645 RepID=A0A9P9EJY8_9PLEO|nr:NADP-dependent oxidoreductase domain-containing protein [Dendryphion nanum]